MAKGVINMDMSPQQYQQFVAARAPKSPIVKDCLFAFVVGGLICVIGQAIMDGWGALGLEQQDAATATAISLVALSALLTGLNLYNKIARFAGAGTLIPITGFANSVVSPAIDFKAEGLITGTAVKMFTIAGPVIVYGAVASMLYGTILMIFG